MIYTTKLHTECPGSQLPHNSQVAGAVNGFMMIENVTERKEMNCAAPPPHAFYKQETKNKSVIIEIQGSSTVIIK